MGEHRVGDGGPEGSGVGGLPTCFGQSSKGGSILLRHAGLSNQGVLRRHYAIVVLGKTPSFNRTDVIEGLTHIGFL